MMNTNANRRDNERRVMKYAKQFGVVGHSPVQSNAWRNAIQRLVANGKLRYSRQRFGYVINK